MTGVSRELDEMTDLGIDNIDDIGEVLVSGNYFDNNSIENEKCGICMDVVIDRGALDCCNHWFCFPCIDNWATITNLCPLCKNEFQLITCIPVFDTLGHFKADEHSISRDDDWCIEEKNSMLSFPAYYINEDAVNCLDGDACKVRNGITAVEEDMILDTSIACDSCDMWYHAFCVGFDPERAMGTSWLCPRCIANRVPDQDDQKHVDYGHPINSDLTGTMSVSVADAGETAVVVSIVDGTLPIKSSADQPECIYQETVTKLGESSGFAFNAMPISQKQTQSHDAVCFPIAQSSSCKNSIEIQDDSKHSEDLSSIMEPEDSKQKISVSQSSDGPKVSMSILSNNSSIRHEPSGKSVLDFHLMPAVTSSPSGGNTVFVAPTVGEIDESEKTADAGESVAKVIDDNDINGRRTQNSRLPSTDSTFTNKTMKRQRELETEIKSEICTKQPRSCVSTPICQQNFSVANSCQGNYEQKTTFKVDKLINTHGKESITSDIMSIVQGCNRRSASKQAAASSSDKANCSNGIRVKKIVRGTENNGSSIIVQKLRKEIQEVVRENPSKDFCKDSAFNGNLLAAFRAAMAGPRNGTVNKVNPSLLRMKRSLLQTGKSRENLTKKIYGTASGRRRRAWDRDWEIEFWKHRCLSNKVEKVETLQSVLDLLKTISSSDSLDATEAPEDDSKNSILSRVYLADTSVFPRAEDIRPLSVIAGTSMTSNVFSNDKESKLGSSPEKNSQNSRIRGESRCQERKELTQAGQNSVFSMRKQKKSAINSGELTQVPLNDTDKRKWALEVLARKKASTDGGLSQGKEENTMLKSSYPLLAQLPVDMKPAVVPGRHNKVPLSVRQAQLYRLTEFYLRRVNLSVITRTAATELAVADAINVEKEIFERSNSKLVYMNLCSQHVTNCKLPATERAKSPLPADPVEESRVINEVASSSSEGVCDITEEALKMTGLFSDSPMNSPDRYTKSPDKKDAFKVDCKDNHNVNVLNQDSKAACDIYEDFAYDLEADGYIDSSRMSRASMSSLPSEGSVALKVAFPCQGSDKLDNDMKSDDDAAKADAVDEEIAASRFDNSKVSEVPLVTSSVPTCKMGRATKDVGLKTSKNCHDLVVQPSSVKENYKDPSVIECEESYGTGKESVVRKFPIHQTSDPVGHTTKSDGPNGDAADFATEKELMLTKFPIEQTSDPVEHMVQELDDAEKELMVTKFPMEQTSDPVGHINKSDGANGGATEFGFQKERCAEVNLAEGRFTGESSPTPSMVRENIPQKETNAHPNLDDLQDSRIPVSQKVESYIKEHIRPLFKSRVITAEQYRWAVEKTRDKVMRYHCKAKNANFLVKEGDKVKKLAEQYVEVAQQTDLNPTRRRKGNSHPTT